MIRPSRRIRARRRGTFEVHLPAEERSLLASLPRQLAETIAGVGSGGAVPEQLACLFPVAYPRDAEAEGAYVELVRRDLAEHHRAALALLEQTADATELSEDDLQGWLAALNDLRLVLGVALEVTEDQQAPDPDHPRFSEWLCYQYLTMLEDEVVEALDAVLAPPRPGADDEVPEDPWGEPLGGLRWDGTPGPPSP